jgi:hypothetical protein
VIPLGHHGTASPPLLHRGCRRTPLWPPPLAYTLYLPAGMNQTDWPTPQQKIAVGYSLFDGPPTGERRRTEPLHGAQGSGSGYSTVRDLIQFVLALQAGRLMSLSSVELMITGKESMEPSGPAGRCVRIPGPPDQRRPHYRELRWRAWNQRRTELLPGVRNFRSGISQLRSASGERCRPYD